MTDKTDVMRGEFEAWARGHYLSLVPWNEPKRGALPNDYMKIETDMAWSGYQAAMQSPAVRELVEKATEAADALDEVGKAAVWPLRKALANFASIAKGDKA